jgi:hypothetical protein
VSGVGAFFGWTELRRTMPPPCFRSGQNQHPQHRAENDCDYCSYVSRCVPREQR